MQNRRRVHRGIALGWLLLTLVAIGLDARLLTTPLTTRFELSSIGGDFTMYYAAAHALWLNPHANIYSLATLRSAYPGGCGQPPVTTYPYQPLLALLLAPATVLPCAVALDVWWQVSFLLWGVVTFWLARDATRQYGPGRGLLVGALCLIYRPIWNGLEHGQLHLLVLFIFVLASRFAVRRRFAGAGGALAVGALLKYLPAIVVAYHLVRGRWRVARAAAVIGAALLAAEVALVGPPTLLGSPAAARADVATYAALHPTWISALPGSALLADVLLVATFVVLALAGWRKWMVNEALGEGWVLCALILALPLAWYHYLTWLLPLLVAVLHAALDGTRAIPPRLSFAAIVRRLPLVGFALILGALLVPGAHEQLIAPALIALWALSGALLLVDTRRSALDLHGSQPAALPSLALASQAATDGGAAQG